MNITAYFKELKQEQLPQITVFTGSEVYFVDHMLKHIQQHFLIPDYVTFNYTFYESAVEVESVLQQVDTLPFFDEKRIVVFYKTGVLKSIKDEAEAKMVALIKNLPSYLHLVFYEPDADNRKSINKQLKKLGTYVEVNKYQKADFNKWIHKQFMAFDKEVSNTILNYLSDRVDYLDEGSEKNLYDVQNIIKVLAQSGEEITVPLIDAYVKVPIEHNIFKLTDAVSEKQMALALKIMGDFIQSGEHPIKILGLLASQYRNMLKVKLLVEAGYDSKTAASKLDIHPFVAKKAAHNATKHTVKQLKAMVAVMTETDVLLKSTGIEGQWLLEKAILKMELILDDQL